MSVGLPEIQCPDRLVSFRPIGLVGEAATNRLPLSYAHIAQQIIKEMEDVAIRAAKAPNAEALKELRKRLFPEYLSLLKAMSGIVLAKLDQCDPAALMAELTRITDESFSELEDEVETHGALYFSDDDHKEIMFDVSTLRRALATVSRFFSIPPKEEFKEQDKKLSEDFSVMLTWSQFHFESLRAAMLKSLTVAPDVMSELIDGLRASVMAYSYARQAVDLRGLLDERYSTDLGEIIWDDEDEELAHAL